MSLEQAAEISIVYADFLVHLTNQFEAVLFGPAYSTGTRVFAKVRGRGWRAFLITDLTVPLRNVFSIPPALQLTTATTTSTPLAYLGVNLRSYLGYWNGNTEVFFNIVSPDKIFTLDFDGIRYFRVDNSLGTPETQIGVAGTRVDLRLVSGELLLKDPALGLIGIYLNVGTQGVGVPPIYGLDNRTGLTTADGSPITLYTTTAANQLYRITADIFATAFTSGTATYTITWTENGGARTMVVTATVVNTLGTATDLINPDNATAITAQLTGVFTATVKLAGVVERLA